MTKEISHLNHQNEMVPLDLEPEDKKEIIGLLKLNIKSTGSEMSMSTTNGEQKVVEPTHDQLNVVKTDLFQDKNAALISPTEIMDREIADLSCQFNSKLKMSIQNCGITELSSYPEEAKSHRKTGANCSDNQLHHKIEATKDFTKFPRQDDMQQNRRSTNMKFWEAKDKLSSSSEKVQSRKNVAGAEVTEINQPLIFPKIEHSRIQRQVVKVKQNNRFGEAICGGGEPNSFRHDNDNGKSVVDEEMKNQLTELKEKLRAAEEQLKHKDEESCRLAKENESKLESANKKYQELERETKKLKEKLLEFEKEMNTNDSETFDSYQPKSIHIGQTEKLQQQLAFYDFELGNRIKEIEKLKSQILLAQKELDSQQEKLDEKDKSHHSRMEQLVSQHQAEILQKDKLLNEHIKISKKLHEQLEEKDKLRDLLLEQLSKRQNIVNEFNANKEKCNANKEEFNACKVELIKKERELKEATLARKKCKEIVQKYRDKNKELKEQLKNSEQKCQELKAKLSNLEQK